MSWGGLLYRAGIAVCAVGLLVSGGLFVRQWLEYRAGENAYEALTETAVTPTPQPQAEAPEEPAGEDAPIQVDFDALSAVNPDVTGWIYLPDSVISYPVVQGGVLIIAFIKLSLNISESRLNILYHLLTFCQVYFLCRHFQLRKECFSIFFRQSS